MELRDYAGQRTTQNKGSTLKGNFGIFREPQKCLEEEQAIEISAGKWMS